MTELEKLIYEYFTVYNDTSVWQGKDAGRFVKEVFLLSRLDYTDAYQQGKEAGYSKAKEEEKRWWKTVLNKLASFYFKVGFGENDYYDDY